MDEKEYAEEGFRGIHKSSTGGAHGVIVIVAGNGHGDTSSNPGWDW